MCSFCQNSEYQNCVNHSIFGKYTKPKLVSLNAKKNYSESDEEDLEDEEHQEEIIWEESDAVQMIREDDIVVVRSGDNYNPYYLIYATAKVEVLNSEFRDDYGHFHPKGQAVLSGNYLEEVQSKNGNRKYFKDTSRVAVISSYCVAGISPELIQSIGQRRSIPVIFFEINENVHEISNQLPRSRANSGARYVQRKTITHHNSRRR